MKQLHPMKLCTINFHWKNRDIYVSIGALATSQKDVCDNKRALSQSEATSNHIRTVHMKSQIKNKYNVTPYTSRKFKKKKKTQKK
jgi:hypothetical protein